MAQIKKYELEDDSYNEVHFEVDHSVLTEENATEINEFWSSSEDRLNDCDGDVIEAVLKLAFITVLALLRDRGWVFSSVNAKNSESFTSEFHKQEGWYECGIKVTYANIADIDFRDISLKVVS